MSYNSEWYKSYYAKNRKRILAWHKKRRLKLKADAPIEKREDGMWMYAGKAYATRQQARDAKKINQQKLCN